MRRMLFFAFLMAGALVASAVCQRGDAFPRLTGPYLGQVLPGEEA